MQREALEHRFTSAVAALDDAGSDLRAGLFAAHLHLHAIRPDAIPEGPLRSAFESLRRRFRGPSSDRPPPRGIMHALLSLEQTTAEDLARELRALAHAVTQH
jgi:hypothetical protein